MNRRISIQVFLCFLVMMFLVVSGCGSSNDAAPAAAGSTISGVAAAGGAIIGTVTIKDSSSPAIEKVTTIDTDGSYSVDVAGLTPPFMLRADGMVGGVQYHLYSAAVTADINGTINITPFTDLIIANMAGDIAENYYKGITGDYTEMDPVVLAAATEALRLKLAPILNAMGLEATIDLLRTSFDTNHTGLDAVIDVVKVTVDPDTAIATLKNILNGEKITVDIGDGGTTTDPVFTDTGVVVGMTYFDAIVKVWSDMSALFATSIPSKDNLLPFIDEATFLDNGETLAQWITGMNEKAIGISFANLVVSSLTATTAEVTFTLMKNGVPQPQEGPKGMCLMVKIDGKWYYQGNRRMMFVNAIATEQYLPNDGLAAPHIWTGLKFDIQHRGTAGAAVQSVVVTGPGLSAPVILNDEIGYSMFMIPSAQAGAPMPENNVYYLTDNTVIGNIPSNAEYTFLLYDTAGGTGNVLATYTSTVPARPLKSTELTVASFPVITAPTLGVLGDFSGGSLTATWTLPDGLSSEWIELTIAGSEWTDTARVGPSLSPAERSKILTIPAPTSWTVANRNLWLTAFDIYNRDFTTAMWQNNQ